jgi:GTP-binding protein
MQFVDEVEIEVRAGDGGNGCIAFRREKYRPMGGPCGGNGGKGGDVIFVADHNLSTLLDLRYQRLYKAERGEHGRGKDQHGRSGRDCEIRIPTGTVLYDRDTGELLADLTEHNERFVALEGGRGGLGNMMFVTSTRQAPDYSTEGESGGELHLKLELKLLADVGVIGFPNVGKSTFIASVSRAKPKIANYPFTTLTPNLGVVAAPGRPSFVMADVPGLIEGAHQGQGLGIRFLKHIERTRVFLHVLELAEDSERDPIQDFETIQRELTLYDEQLGKDLAQRPMIVAMNKVEDPDLGEICQEEYAPYFKEKGLPFFLISAKTGAGVTPLLHALSDAIDLKSKEEKEEKEEGETEKAWDPLAQNF